MDIKYSWKIEELQNFYEMPFLKLLSNSHAVFNKWHEVGEVQVCSLISIKTGGCPEDCKYCPQSSRYQTSVSAQPLMEYNEVINDAKRAVERGATRICLGAAWRMVRDNKQFDAVLEMIKGVAELGVEVCCTLGMLNEHQAVRLKEAGLYAYNHNLDSSENFYPTIITTRTYQDRLNTLNTIEKAQLSVCCGGIIGMGESIQDRLELLQTLANRNPHPESVPINQLTQVPGTPLENQANLSIWEVVRMISVARIVLPKAIIRLSCGRIKMSFQDQALCFFAGANSIFMGEKLLTVPNTACDKDEEMFQILGLKKRATYSREKIL